MDAKPILILIVQIGLILALSRIMGFLFARFRQPQVVGEMAAGIMLGPSLLGWLFPGVQASLFPADSIRLL
ncbi:MAG TPA: cation:proton antiporter, partial [Tepidisphaeraceae bacterium]|nr:cation:proton antiporter [Tepidisphaeraceae bacterium]